jgi:hypothetical protein
MLPLLVLLATVAALPQPAPFGPRPADEAGALAYAAELGGRTGRSNLGWPNIRRRRLPSARCWRTGSASTTAS